MTSRQSSGSSCAAMLVEFTKSQNSTVRWRRSPSVGVTMTGVFAALAEVAGVGPILKLLDGQVIAGLAPGTATEECARNIDHVLRALALVKQWSPAPGAEASGRVCLGIMEASDTSLAHHDAGMLAPTTDVSRIRGAVGVTARRGGIMPGPKSRKVDLQLHGTAKAAA